MEHVADTRAAVFIGNCYLLLSCQHFSTFQEGTLCPVIKHGDVTFVFINFSNLYMVATTNKNSNVMMITTFMHNLCQVNT